jgi:CubicO group peptidase (beta-lactamase class C family)
MRLAITTALALVAVSLPASAQSLQRLGGSPLTPAQIDSTVNRLITDADVTGAGIALFHAGRIAYLHAYGLRNTDSQLPLTPDSVMTSASLSKAAFATMVMKLVQQGKLDLDKPIAQYLPKPLASYPNYTDLQGDPRAAQLTLRMLLSHTSGFPNWRFFTDDRKLHIFFTPGSRFAYSGEGIDLAQFVVETVTSQSDADLMRDQLFVPLHMTRTSMTWQPAFDTNFAGGFDQYNRDLGPEKRTRADAAGSMQTTLRDYATFLSAVLRDRALSPAATNSMLSPQIAIHSAHQFPSLATETSTAFDSIQLSYGLGWGLFHSPFGPAFFKEGHDDGGWQHLALLFRNGDGLLIMTNCDNGEGIFKPLADALLGPTGFPFDWEGYTPYNLRPPLPPLKSHKRAALTEAQYQHVTGRYILNARVAISITFTGGQLFVQENDEPAQQLLPESPENFYSTTSSDEYTCTPATGPHAQLLVLHADGEDFKLTRANSSPGASAQAQP